MTLLASVARETWNLLLVASPFLLVGMLAAGLLHLFLARRHVERWLGGEGLLSVVIAAALGIPLPLCSCGVVPVAMALRRHGASRAATLSFLITTPESGADSVVLTWGMLGPVMAIARPIAGFFTAILAGVVAIASGEDGANRSPAATPNAVANDAPDDAHVITLSEFWRSLQAYVWPARGKRKAKPHAAAHAAAPAFEDIVGDVFHYAFVELADDIAFWLVVGVVVGGTISALLPEDLAAGALGSGFTPMLLLLLAGVPLSMCASASTPIAAALVAKGVSPGAALVFLLSGPATNAATIVLLARHFGARFTRIYVGSVVVATLLCGLALDWWIGLTGWHISATTTGGQGGVALVEWLSALILSAVLAWRLWSGAGRRGVAELAGQMERLGGLAADGDATARRRFWRLSSRRVVWVAMAAIGLIYVMNGLRIVPADGRGYGFLFGRLVWPDLAPGIQYVPPAPFGRCDIWRVQYPRVAGVGFRPDVAAVAKRRQLTDRASGELWHSPVTAGTTDSRTATFLTGDENLLEMSFAVQYGLSDPRAFFYALDRPGETVGLYAETVAREAVARQPLDSLLTSGRGALEREVAEDLQRRLDALHAGVAVTAVRIVDLHPPQGAIAAFRDVSSAREDRETAINRAATAQAKEIPLARGQSAVELSTAQATAASAATEARGQADAMRAEGSAYASAPDIVGTLLWLETAERVLAGRTKLIVPPGSAGQNLVVWKTAPSSMSADAPAFARPLPPIARRQEPAIPPSLGGQ